MKAVDIQGNLNLKEQSCCKLNLKNRNERFAHFSSCCSCIRPLVKCTFDSKKSPHTHTNYLFQQIETSLFKKKTDWFYVCQTQNKQYLHALWDHVNVKIIGERSGFFRIEKQPVPDFEMTITPLNSKFSVYFDEVNGISRHFHEAQTLNFLWTCPILNLSGPSG